VDSVHPLDKRIKDKIKRHGTSLCHPVRFANLLQNV